MFPLDRENSRSLYLQISDYLDQQITAGYLPPGSLLPPIRSLAERLNVSKNTVTMAYSELEAMGRVAGRVGQGTVVQGDHSPRAPAPPRPFALPQSAPGSAVLNDLLRLSQQPGLINFTTSAPPPDLFPQEPFARALRTVLQEVGPSAFGYGDPKGFEPFRQAIARLAGERGISAGAEQVVVTSGAQQALDLAIRTLVAPGEWVLAESPCYMGALEIFGAHRLRVGPAPMDEFGLNPDLLEPILRRLRPRLLYTTPTFQNPTGATMPLERRRKLIELAARWDLVILEDGVCSEFELTGPAPPPLRALDGNVIYCNSFSKGILPGLRLGYLVAPEGIVERLVMMKQAADLGSPALLQRTLTRFLEEGHYHNHLKRCCTAYRERRQAMLEALAEHLPPGSTWTTPSGGLNLWAVLPPGVDLSALYIAAIGRGIGFAPGPLFFAAGTQTQGLRLSYGAEGPARIRTGIARLAGLITGT